jgi:ectoine hydroxylase-related dioxygenase (phytanoyl-CoA dioxygenase family)
VAGERQIVGDFWRDGAVCVRNAFHARFVDLAREAIDANLADLSPLAITTERQRGIDQARPAWPGNAVTSSAADDGAFVEDFCNWQRIEPLRRFVIESPAAEIAAELMGAGTVRLYHDHVLVKEPGTAQRTPWHQDLPYYNVDGRLNASMWFPVDPVARESTLEFVAGSHLGPWFLPRTFLDGAARWFPDGALAELPPIDERRGEFRVIGWELEPGDAVFFHMLTLHGAGGVGRDRRRRVLSVRFLGDDMVHAPRRWDTSPPFPGLAGELADGAPMDHPLFPVLWEAGR